MVVAVKTNFLEVNEYFAKNTLTKVVDSIPGNAPGGFERTNKIEYRIEF